MMARIYPVALLARSRRKKKALTAVLLVAGMTAASLMAASPAHASTTFTVNLPGDTKDANTSDSLCDVNLFGSGNQCTLRAAIEQANATPGSDTIDFDIPDDFGAGVKTINVGATGNGGLPAIAQTVTIDGYTQPGAHPNTQAVGDDAQILVELNGSGAGSGAGLRIAGASNSVIRGLAINRFSTAGISIDSDLNNSASATGNRIEGNFIGTDPTGTQDLGNGFRGVAIFTNKSNNNVVGGTSPAARNIISGNEGPFGAVDVVNGGSGNEVQGNYIGTDRTGTKNLGNGDDGIAVSGSNNTIGGTTPGAGNVISGNNGTGIVLSSFTSDFNNKVLGNRIGTTANGAGPLGNGSGGIAIISQSGDSIGDGTAAGANIIAFNGQDGIAVTDNASGNTISRNSIFSNSASGIDLDFDGPTANDTGDADTGANALQNFPDLSSVKSDKRGTSVAGRLNSIPNSTFTLQFFSSPSGQNEGQTFLGQKSVTTDSSGNVSFTFKTKKKVAKGQNITATATANASGDTSEFSAPKTRG